MRKTDITTIHWEDLTSEAQKRLLEDAGIESPEEIGWDEYVTDVDIEDREEQNWVNEQEEKRTEEIAKMKEKLKRDKDLSEWT